GAHCTVHYDPIQVSDKRVIALKKYLHSLKKDHDIFKRFHDVRLLDTEEFHIILFDMVTSIDPSSEEVKHLKVDIENHIKDEFPKFEVKINITPIFKAQGD
ncbi:MAG: hypothetical protein KAI81_05390, partial [Candidatus Marinimicrobia bacterium]|nr:hypothetical protein [Candidatus Neomarinimicrobiota bacterium]